MAKTGRNAPCSCGSGKKYKECCWGKVRPPVDLLWRRLGEVHDRLIDEMLPLAHERLGMSGFGMALDEFLTWPETDEDIELPESFSQLFFPWLLFNWQYDPLTRDSEQWDDEPALPPGMTVARLYVEENGGRLNTVERRLIEAVDSRPFSFYQVVSVNPGYGFRLKDLFKDDEIDILEKLASESVKQGSILFARIARVDHVSMLVGCGPVAIPSTWKPSLVGLKRMMSAHYSPITDAALAEFNIEIREAYIDAYERLTQPPQLCNTDGDPLLYHKIHYSIDDPESVFHLLAGLSVTRTEASLRQSADYGVDDRIVSAAFEWDRKGYKNNRAIDNTVLGSIRLDGHALTIEVNSGQRAEIIKKEIARRLGGRAEYKATEIVSPESMMAADDGSGSSGDGEQSQEALMQIPEIREKLEAVLRAHWEDWDQMPVPALGGKTPRMAVKTADGREQVAALLLAAVQNAENDPVMGDVALAQIEKTRARLGVSGDVNRGAPPPGGARPASGEETRNDATQIDLFDEE